MRSNEQWIADLKDAGRAAEAQQDLRQILFQGLRKGLRDRRLDSSQIEDFTQDALIRVLNHLSRFRGDSRFTTWALSIGMRVAFSELRRSRWKDVSLEALTEDSSQWLEGVAGQEEAGIEEAIQQRAVLEVLQRSLQQDLTSRQRQVLLGELEGIPKAVLADHFGTNRNALYKLSHDARKRLKASILAAGLSAQEIRRSFEL